MPFTGLVMQPHEMEIVKDIFTAIVTEPWFHRTTSNDKAFAEFVLHAYRAGITDRAHLLVYCHEAAALWYSRHA